LKKYTKRERERDRERQIEELQDAKLNRISIVIIIVILAVKDIELDI
jgi:hypothetical protein